MILAPFITSNIISNQVRSKINYLNVIKFRSGRILLQIPCRLPVTWTLIAVRSCDISLWSSTVQLETYTKNLQLKDFMPKKDSLYLFYENFGSEIYRERYTITQCINNAFYVHVTITWFMFSFVYEPDECREKKLITLKR